MNKRVLFEGVGDDARVGCVAIRVAKGDIEIMKDFFERLGFDVTAKASNVYGEEYFMSKAGSTMIQLTQLWRDEIIVLLVDNVSIEVKDPATVIKEIETWSEEDGVRVKVDKVGEKYFVSFPGTLGMSLVFHCPGAPSS